MNPNLKKYKVTPSVIPADKESVITISSLDGNLRFYDDVTYEVKIYPQDMSDVPLDEEMSLLGYNTNRKTLYVKPVNGELKIKYYFGGEQEWKIRVSTKEYKKYQNPIYKYYSYHWDHLIFLPENGIDFYVYSLKEDLYSKRALRGDLHLHTIRSDGDESPEYVAARYRKAGRDFIAITDHNVFYSQDDAKVDLDFVKNFKIIPGEETHNGYLGFLHTVNIGGNYSLNEIYINDPERVKREVAELEKEVEVPEGLDKKEYLNRVWLYREAKKSGGFVIHAHPYWNIGFYHTSTEMSKAMIKNGLCDAFEVIGGCTRPSGNNLQVALYNELRAEGYDIPIVGSTDSHSVLKEEYLKRSTVTFTDNDDIIDAISKGYSVAVESEPGEKLRVYGKLRYVMYTHFLLENYFPVHEDLCSVSGTYLEEYVHGSDELKSLIEKAEEKVVAFEKEFFGR